MRLVPPLIAIILGAALAHTCANQVVINNLVRGGLVLGALLAAAALAYITFIFNRIRRPAIGVTAILATTIAIAPIRTSHADLQSASLQEAMGYLNAPYVWGGESHLGIDCSGLPRAALRQATLRLFFENRDPALLRVFAFNWLIDVPAKGMLAGRGNDVVASAKSILELPTEARVTGNLVATADGTHVMMVVDERHVIEADPAIGHVVKLEISDKSSPWTTRPVVALRPRPY